MNLKIGPLSIPKLAGINTLTQDFEPLGGESIFRTASGGGLKQMTWGKTRILTTGSGWIPPGLAALDYTQSMVLECIKTVEVMTDGAPVTLPAARRTDLTPFCIAILERGQMVPCGIVVDGDLATPVPVAGSEQYCIQYFPIFEVWAMRPRSSFDRLSATWSWELVCEEV